MYRVQLSGGQYRPNAEVGLHYQIHRGIGVHHAAAIRRGEPLRVNVFVGGAPAMTLAAVMPLPEGLSRAGVRRGARRAARADDPQPPSDGQHWAGGLPIYAEADFCITGTVDPKRTAARGTVRRSPGLLQPGARFSGAARRAGVSSRRMRSGRSRSSAGRRRKTRSSASSFTS